MHRLGLIAVVGLLVCAGARGQSNSQPVGEFEGQSDLGQVLHPGSAEYDPQRKAYTLTGSGDNMWFATDEFHFVWKKIAAEDVTLTANISIAGTEGNGHRKGVLMIRQSLDSDSAYVDAARHAEGLTSLQFREEKGATTHEIESSVSGPAKLRIEKQGDRFYMWIAGENEDLQFAGGSARVEMRAPFYVGIGVTAHDKNAVAKVVFEKLTLETSVHHPKAKYSTIETVLQSGDVRSGYVSREHLTSPGWSADGHALTFQVHGKEQQVPFTPLRTAAPVGAPVSGQPDRNDVQLPRKKSYLSPDGKFVAFLSPSKNPREMSLQVMSVADKKTKTLATFVGGPDSLGKHPWSPDGKRLVFVSYESMR